MDFEDIPLRTAADDVDVSWWNSLRQAGIDSTGSQTTSLIANNQSSAANITDMSFDSGTFRAIFISYYVRRIADSTVMEVGKLALWYDGSSWIVSKAWYLGNAEIEFSITGAGQVQYTTDNMSGSYDTSNSKMVWRSVKMGA